MRETYDASPFLSMPLDQHPRYHPALREHVRPASVCRVSVPLRPPAHACRSKRIKSWSSIRAARRRRRLPCPCWPSLSVRGTDEDRASKRKKGRAAIRRSNGSASHRALFWRHPPALQRQSRTRRAHGWQTHITPQPYKEASRADANPAAPRPTIRYTLPQPVPWNWLRHLALTRAAEHAWAYRGRP